MQTFKNDLSQMNEHHGLVNPNSILGIMLSLFAIFLQLLAKVDIMGWATTIIAIVVGVSAAANNILSFIDKINDRRKKKKEQRKNQ